jgi:hypothetical protein
MNEEQAKELLREITEGIVKLYHHSESAGDDVSLNPARVSFLALSGFLAGNGVLDALSAYAHYIENSDEYPQYTPEKLPVV